jgi:hypothetical protein
MSIKAIPLANKIRIPGIDKHRDSSPQYFWNLEMVWLKPVSREQEALMLVNINANNKLSIYVCIARLITRNLCTYGILKGINEAGKGRIP